MPELLARLPDGARPLFQRLLGAVGAPPRAIVGESARPSSRMTEPTPPTSLPRVAPPPAPPSARGVAREHAAPAPFALVTSCVGLTLLHPFLPPFFDVSKIARPSPSDLAPADLSRAAALLFFLATGEDEALEHELGFIKVLLGLEPASPLPIAAGLVTDADREEAESLLEAVIDHWGALGRTSIGGLRASFLERRGLLHEEGRCFRLHVETAAHDVLLQRLPWSISVIKLPWMRKPIFTEWPVP